MKPRKLLIALMFAVLAMGFVPALAFAEEGAEAQPLAPSSLDAQEDAAYAILYEDGMLVFQRGNATDEGRAVKETWTGFDADGTHPWTESIFCYLVKKAVFKDSIAPTSLVRYFQGCSGMVAIEGLSRLDTSEVRDMDFMFYNCSSLETLDLSSFDTSNVKDMSGMFYCCGSLSELSFGPGFEFVDSHNGNAELPDVEDAVAYKYDKYAVGYTEVYTGKWERASDKATATSAELVEQRDDLQGTWAWQRKPDSEQRDSGNQGQGGGNSGSSETADKPKTDLATYAGEAKKAGFKDLDAGAWYLNDGGRFPDSQTLYLDYTIARGLMSGYTGARKGQFGPDDDLSRGMAATIIYRMATGKTAETTDNDVDTPFSDVPRGAWYAAAVKWCAENKVVTGYVGTTKFGPDDPITREQLATVIGRYMDPQAEAGSDVSQFKDASSISAFARAGIAYCCANGIMTGIGDSGNFQPGGKATRCQMSKVIAVTARMVE